jgi:hypothetical protein
VVLICTSLLKVHIEYFSCTLSWTFLLNSGPLPIFFRERAIYIFCLGFFFLFSCLSFIVDLLSVHIFSGLFVYSSLWDIWFANTLSYSVCGFSPSF